MPQPSLLIRNPLGRGSSERRALRGLRQAPRAGPRLALADPVSGSHAGGVDRRAAGDGAEAGVGVLAELAGGGEEGGEDGALLGAGSGSVAARDLVVDDAV